MHLGSPIIQKYAQVLVRNYLTYIREFPYLVKEPN
ncbi:MAG: hypothetical protein ACI9LN_004684, partial [Saprospiraceae bacterium]